MEIPACVAEIGERAFRNATLLESVAFAPDSALRRIAAEAFAGSGIVTVSLPDGVLSIGDRAFAGCRSLEEVVCNKSGALTEIGAEAFAGSGIQRFEAPKSLKTVGDAAFMGCARLRSGKAAILGRAMPGALCFWNTGI